MVKRFLLAAAFVIALLVLSCTKAPAQQPSRVPEIVQPVLVCSPDSLSFTAVPGQATEMERVLNIYNQGGGVMDWTVSDNVRWIEVKQQLGSAGLQGGTVRVAVDPSGMAPGEYTGIVTIMAEGALGSPCHVPVFLAIPPAEPVVAVPSTSQQEERPPETAVIWKNQNDLVRYADVNSCYVRGSVTNSDTQWYLGNVIITASTGSTLIATSIPPGETVIYSRYIPCYQREEVKLTYNWYKP